MIKMKLKRDGIIKLNSYLSFVDKSI